MNGEEILDARLEKMESTISNSVLSMDWWKMFSAVTAAVGLLVSAVVALGNWALSNQLAPVNLKLEIQQESLSAVTGEIGKIREKVAEIDKNVAVIKTETEKQK